VTRTRPYPLDAGSKVRASSSEKNYTHGHEARPCAAAQGSAATPTPCCRPHATATPHSAGITYVQRCDRELKAGGLTSKRTTTAVDALTPRKQAVAALIARGMSTKEAASELFLSVKTVQCHLTRIDANLGIRTRSELAAHQRGPRTEEQR